MPTLTIILTLLILLLMTAMAPAAPAGGAQVYVAPDGNDTAAGTSAAPLKTLSAARDAVRKLKTAGKSIEVILKPGTYFLTEPLTLGPEDSGVTWKAQVPGKAIISGGVPISGWKKGEGGVWSAKVSLPPSPLPNQGGGAAATTPDFRLLRVGDSRAIRARYPNYEPDKPYTGGWLFADFGGEPWEKGAWGTGISNNHTVGDHAGWTFKVPADGTYRVWLRYGHKMTDYGTPDMAGHSTFSMDGGEAVPLQNLPDTGDWGTLKWSHCADFTLTAGEHKLLWTNVKGGGMNIDAIALCDDPAWDAAQAIKDFQWWGAADIKPTAEGKHLVIIQAEAADVHEGKEMTVAQATPPGTFKNLRCKPGALPNLGDLSDAEVHIFPAWGWVSAIVPIERADYAKNEIVFPGNGAAQDIRMGNRFFIENARAALDAPGEFFFDKQAGEVLYIPSDKAFPKQETVTPVLDRLIVLQGDAEKLAFVENVSFEGLKFADTTYTVTTDYYSPQDATVVMAAAKNCHVRNCDFAWLGGYGVKLMQRSEQCTVSRCKMTNMGQGGVILVGGTKEQAHHCAVLGCTMDRLGLIYKHVAGVYLIHGSDNRVAHNRITNVPRYAVSFKSQGEDRLSHNNICEYNDIRFCNLETNDTGAFESLGYEHRDSGNVVRFNRILDSVGLLTTPEGEIKTPYFTWGIYLDDYSSGTTVYGNIVARNVVGGGCIHGGQNNHFENNIFVDGYEHQMRCQPRDDFMKGNTFVNNIVMYHRPEAAIIWSYRDKPDMFSDCNRNLYWLVGGDILAQKNVMPAGTYQKWQAEGHDVDSVIADPLFVDAAKDDYRLKDNSPAFKLGFKRIPVEKIGPEGLE